MLRPFLMRMAARAKSAGLLDTALRYNPIATAPVHLAIREAGQGQDTVRHLTERLTRQMLKAAQRTRYGANRSLTYADWPILEKETLKASPGDFVNQSTLIKLPAATGGTTGVPLPLWRSAPSVAAEQAFIGHLLKPYNLSMGGSRMAVLRADAFKGAPDFPHGRISHGGKRLTLASANLSRETLPWFHETLQKFQPEILWIYPNAALSLLQLLEQAGKKLSVPVVLSSSEMLLPELHRKLARTFGAKVVNYYGQAERVCFAYSTEPGSFRFHPAYGRVELLPAGTGEDGGQLFEIIGTGYWNSAMPLIRYRTGDLIELPQGAGAQELDDIAMGAHSFPGILGRDGEYLLKRDGTRIIGLNQIPREIGHIYQLQLVQTDFDKLTVRVAAAEGFTDADERHILANARAKLPSSFEITVDTKSPLILNALGKAPFVVRQVG